MDKNAVEWKPEPQEETTVLYDNRTSEVIVNVVRDAISTQHRALEASIMTHDRDSAQHIVETLIVLEKLLDDIGEVCDKFGWYY